jgi:hypothetical protein
MDRRSDPSYADRAAARASWDIRCYELGKEPGDDLSATTTGAERIEMMWQLACDAWSFAGRSFPDYSRSQAPISVIHPTSPAQEI